MFANLFGGGGQPQANPQQMAEWYGVPPEVYQQLMGERQAAVLGQLGATLLAAGQGGQLGDRGRILASGLQGIGDHGNRFNTNLLNSHQMRLYAEQVRAQQGEREARQKFAEGLKLGTVTGLTPEQIARLQSLDPKTAYEVYTKVTEAGLKKPEWGDPEEVNGQTVIRNQLTNEIKPVGQPPQFEREEDKRLGQAYAERRVALEAGGQKAAGQIQRLNLLEGMMGAADTGMFADAFAQANRFLRAIGQEDRIESLFGLNPNQDTVRAGINTIVNEMVVGMIGSEEGGFPANNFSDADRAFLRAIFPEMADDPQAIKDKVEILRRTQALTAEKYDAWISYQEQAEAAGQRVDFNRFERAWQQTVQEAAKKGGGIFADMEEKYKGLRRDRTGSGGAVRRYNPATGRIE
jgi:hypothetical protein